ncbi:MAG: hypothetical protein ABEL76_14570 [Bradymonadaceae bacterium]
MSEPFRSVGPRERALYLKTLPFADALKPEDVMMAALQMDERRFDEGEALLDSTTPIDAMYILVDGSARLEREREVVGRLEAPARAGLIGLLASEGRKGGERTPPGDIVADSTVRALELSGPLMEQLIDTSFDFLASLLRWVADQLLDEQPRALLASACAALVTSTEAQLSLYDRVRWLHESTLFGQTDLDAVFEIARRQRPRRLEDGELLWRAGDDPDAVYSLVRGCVGGQEFVGLLEALAGRPYSESARADGQVLGLELRTEDLYTAMTDHGDIGIDLLRELAGWALEHRWRETDAEETEQVEDLDAAAPSREGEFRATTGRLPAIE